jgi:hypothetical protein
MKKLFIIGCLLLTSACNLPIPTPTTDPPLTATPLPSPVPVTETQPAATLKPLPLYFTEEFDSNSPYWEFLQAGGTSTPVTSFQSDSLHIDISSPDTWFIGIHNANSYPNVFVRAKTSATPTGSVGLICRYSEDGWYEFNVSNDGTYSLLLGQWLSPGIVKYAPIINDLSNKLTGSTASEIGLFCEDNFLQLYANGTMIRRVEVTNYGLTEGKIGITAASFAEIPMSAIFEWVQVSQD